MKLAYSRKEACHELSIGTTKLHELINAQKLRAVKVGGKTLVTGESLVALIAGEA
jgi:excisionase family DNA binding protein